METTQDRAPGSETTEPPAAATVGKPVALRQEIEKEPGAPIGATPELATAPVPRAGTKGAPPSRFAAAAMVGHHEVIRLLGRGGMGEVYLARDTRLGRRVALKFLLRVDAARLARFGIEARATAQLAHENIVALHDIAEHEGLPYMVLEHVQGKSLADWLKERAGGAGRHAGLPAVRAAELMIPVARALVCAHEAGIVHRDLKPDNIMLADSGTVKVLDFGIAKLLGDAESPVLASSAPGQAGAAAVALTRPGAVMGTIAYMSPEQWAGDAVDERADLWAVGIMLHELVTGEHPLAPLSLLSLASVTVLTRPMPSVRERLPTLGKLGAVIDRCLIKPKASRLGSARELLGELEAVARPALGAAGDAREDTLRTLASRPSRSATRRASSAGSGPSSRWWRASASNRCWPSWAPPARGSRRWCAPA